MVHRLMLFSMITFELLLVTTAQLRVHEWNRIKKYELIRKRTTKNCQCEENYSASVWGEWSRCESVGKLTCHRALRYRMMACSSRSSCMKEEWWHCLDTTTCEGEWERVKSPHLANPTCDPECINGLKPILHLCTNNGTIGEFCDRRGYYKIMMSPCKNSEGCNTTAEMVVSVNEDMPDISEGTHLVREDPGGSNFEVNLLVWILGGVIILLFTLAASLTFCFASNRQKQKLAENRVQNSGITEQVNMGSWTGKIRKADERPTQLPPPLPNSNYSQSQSNTTGRNGLTKYSPRKPRMNRLMSEPVVGFTRNPEYASMGRRGRLGSQPHTPSDQYFVPFDSKTTLPGTKPNYAVPNSRPAPPRTIERLSSATKKPWYDVPKVLGDPPDNSLVKTLPKMSIDFGRVHKHGTIVEAPIQLEEDDNMYEKIK